MTAQEKLAESAMKAAALCPDASTAAHYRRLAAAHLEVAAKMVPCKRGVPTDPEARQRIAARYREVLNYVMADARRPQ